MDSTRRDGPAWRAEIPSGNHWAEQIKCQAACPVRTDARGYVQAIAHGDFERAYLIARAPNPLASICGRICGAPCETECRRGEIDSPIRIRALKRFVTEKFGPESGADRVERLAGWVRKSLGGTGSSDARFSAPGSPDLTALPSSPSNPACGEGTRPLLDPNTRGSFEKAPGQRVAIIGSGPAGLAAAHDLALMGFRPVIYEMEPVPAGMLAVGVPEYRLPRDLIRAEVQLIRELGVEIRCNTAVGRDVSLPELREDYDAVVIAVGAKKSRVLDIPGREAEGVHGGVEFLRDVALDVARDLGRRVVVIGGGNVAFDVGRSVIRNTQLDAATVAAHLPSVAETHICCLESREEMPADQVEIIEAGEEGIRLHTSLGPKAILVQNGRVSGVEFARCTRVFDENRRFSPLFDETKTSVIPCDSVLLAIGQSFDLGFIDPARDGIELARNGAPRNDPETLETTARNVWVAGDAAHGVSLMIHAIASGKRAARSSYERFTGTTIAPEALELHVPLPDFAREYDYEARQRVALTVVPAAERVREPTTQVELPLLAAQATHEAGRCLNCGVNTIFDSVTCILCGGCVDICPSSCLKIVGLDELEMTDELASLHENLLDGAPASAILKDDATCIRCGLCAVRCPVSAITMEEFRIEETAR